MSIRIEGPIGRDGPDLKQLRKKEGQEPNARQAQRYRDNISKVFTGKDALVEKEKRDLDT